MTIRRISLAAGTAVAALALAACGSGSSAGSGASSATSASSPSTVTSSSAPTESSSAPSSAAGGKIVVGAANFSESEILANLYAAALDKAGFKASVKVVGAREIYEPALEKGSSGGGIDVVPEYLATFTEFLNDKKNGANAPVVASSDVDKTLAAGQPFANGYGITLLTPSAATDENAFAVTTKFAKDNNLTTLSDLAGYKGKLTLGGPSECPKRPFCELGLEKTYGIKFAGFKALDAGGPLTKQAILQGKVQVGLVFSSSSYGGTSALGLQVLTDDKHLQNADNVVAAVNTKAASDAVKAALNAVDAALTQDDLVALNKSVDIDRKDPAAAAKAYAASKGLG
jgi:osmoprotectant transport system substrate-binding protein